MKQHTFILHFRPLENYPPIQNLLYILSEESFDVTCISTKGSLERNSYLENINVRRYGTNSKGKLGLWLTYMWYNLSALFLLILHRPKKVLYYETLSAYPVYIYKRFVKPSAYIYIHYHEYISQVEYRNSSIVERYFHTKERYLYPKAKWISHTNKVRLAKFLNDEKLKAESEIYNVMPNYPLKKWPNQNRKLERGKTLKLIYVGHSLTEESSYLSELVAFLKESEFRIELSVYCMLSNVYLNSFEVNSSDDFTFKIYPPVAYDQLPQILSNHHVGLILYNAKTDNVTHCAPNKLFEYLSCGLDVWYPNEMQGIHEYDTELQPKVLRLEYNQLEKYNLTELITTTTTQNKFTYFAEDIYARFLIVLKKNE